MQGGVARRYLWLLAATLAMPAAAPPPAAAQGDGTWTAGKPLLKPRRLLAAAEQGGRIYAFGGCGSPCFSPPQHVSTFEETRVEVYYPGTDPGTDRWQSRRPMPYVFFGGAAAAPGDGFVYTLGGMVSGGVVERYDPAADAWSRRAALPTPRHGLAAVALGDLVYAVGGSDGRAATGALEIYDPSADSWTRGPPMPTPRAQLAAAAVGGRLFAIGGSPDCCGGGATAVVEVYDPATGAWTAAAPLPSPRQVSAAAAIEGRLYVFGGFLPGTGVLAETLEYDPGADRWSRLADLPTRAGEEGAVAGRDQAAVAVLDRRAVLVGGSVDCHCQALPDVVIFDPGERTADLSCTLATPAPAAGAGDRVSFTLTARNDGPDAAPGARVVLRLPPQLGDLTWTCAASPGAACPPTGAGGLAARVDLPAGGSLRFELAATVAASATCPLPTSLAVSARASTPAGVRDPRRGNNACAVAVTYDPAVLCPPPTVTKTVSLAEEGDVVKYVVTLVNPSAVPLPDAEWVDTLPPEVSPLSADAGIVIDGQTWRWNGALQALGRVELRLRAVVEPGNAGLVVCNQGALFADAEPDDMVDPPPIKSDDPFLPGLADPTCFKIPLVPPTVTKTVSPAEGDVVEYVVTLVNPSAVPLPDAEWVDTLPPEVSPLSADAGIVIDGQTWRWNGALQALGRVELRLRAVVEPGNAGLVVCNQGALFADAEPDDMVDPPPIKSDDPFLPGPADPTCFKIPPVPPTVIKTVSPARGEEGDVIEYVVTLVNSSAVPLPDGPGDEWVDTLPPEVSPLEISADAGVAELDGQTARWNGALPARDSVEIRLLAMVEPGTAGLVVCNQGALFADAEPDDMVDPPPIKSDDPSLPGSEDPTCFEIKDPVGPVPIPALGGAGRPLVVVLIAVVGVIVLRRWGRRGLRRA